jgi:hypothetical protein
VAQSCCDQTIACFAEPSCIDDVTCFFDCVANGDGPPVCFFQCVSSPQAVGLIVCIGTSCGNGTCF